MDAMRNARKTHADEDMDRYMRAQALYNDRVSAPPAVAMLVM